MSDAPIQMATCATVDLRELTRGSVVIVVVNTGVGVYRKEGETMRELTAEPIGQRVES